MYWKPVGAFDQLNPWGSLAVYSRSQYPVTGTSWTVPFLANGTPYMFYVQPVNGYQSRGCTIGPDDGCTFPVFGYPTAPPLSIGTEAQQDPDWCCTATARSTLAHWGISVSQSTLAPEIGALKPIAYGFADPRNVASAISRGGHAYTAWSSVGGGTLYTQVLNAVNFNQGPVIIVAQTNRLP